MGHQLAIIGEPGGCAQRLLTLACHLSFLTECRGGIEASAGRSNRSKSLMRREGVEIRPEDRKPSR
jgi:hypothetical protein